MNAFKLHTLKQKLWAVVAASFVARIVMFLALPNTYTSFVPDEGTYASLTKWVSESKPAGAFPAFGESLYLSARTLIVPASGLVRVGISEYDSIRLVSSLYGLLCLVIVVFIALKLTTRTELDYTSRIKNEKLILIVILVYAFLPSHILWSTLGLREAANEAWLMISFVVFHYLNNFKSKIKTILLVFLPISIFMVFSSRPQVGIVLTATFLIATILNRQLKNTFKALLTLSILIGGLLGLQITNTNSSYSNVFTSTVQQIESIPEKQVLNQVNAISKIEMVECPFDGTINRPNLTCTAWRTPYMVSTFLFRPILGLDVTSTASLIAAVENVFWLILFVTIIVLAIRKRAISFLAPILPPLIFFALYVLGASAYQGNMGTGFRHKSLILWVVLLLIIALAWEKPEEASKKQGNNSQESAV
jgi:hypothetical protein